MSLALSVHSLDLATWKPLRDRGGHLATGTSGTRLFLPDSHAAQSASTAGRGVFWFDPADHAVAGYVTKLRLAALQLVNAAAPAADFTFGLYPVTAATGPASAVAVTLGTVVDGSTAAIASPAASSINRVQSGEFDAPAAGAFALAVSLSAATAANSESVCRVVLSVRHTPA